MKRAPKKEKVWDDSNSFYQARLAQTGQLLQCCGMFGIEGFPFDDQHGQMGYVPGGGIYDKMGTERVTVEDVRKEMKYNIRRTTYEGRGRSGEGYLNLALVTAEQKIAHKALLLEGFKPLKKWRNANSGVVCHLLGKVVR